MSYNLRVDGVNIYLENISIGEKVKIDNINFNDYIVFLDKVYLGSNTDSQLIENSLTDGEFKEYLDIDYLSFSELNEETFCLNKRNLLANQNRLFDYIIEHDIEIYFGVVLIGYIDKITNELLVYGPKKDISGIIKYKGEYIDNNQELMSYFDELKILKYDLFLVKKYKHD